MRTFFIYLLTNNKIIKFIIITYFDMFCCAQVINAPKIQVVNDAMKQKLLFFNCIKKIIT